MARKPRKMNSVRTMDCLIRIGENIGIKYKIEESRFRLRPDQGGTTPDKFTIKINFDFITYLKIENL